MSQQRGVPAQDDTAERSARRRPSWRDDRGAGTIEYQGILVVAALLVAVVVGSTVIFPDATQAAVCRIESVFDGGSCDSPAAADGPTDEDFLPGVCALAETSSGGSGGVKIGFVKLGADWGMTVTQYSDDKVHATLTNGVSAGVEVSAGANGTVAAAEAKASLDGTYQHGDTWIVDADDWPDFEREARTYFEQADRRWLGAGTLWGARAPRDADVSSHEGGAELAGSAGVSLGMSQETDNPSVTTNLTVAEAGVDVSGGVSVRWDHNKVDDTRTKTYTVQGSAGAGASAVTVGGSVEGARVGSVSIKRDADGRLLEISFETVSRGGVDHTLGASGEIIKQPGGRRSKTNDYGFNGGVGGGTDEVVVTTTTLEVTSANRSRAESWLEDQRGGILAVGVPLSPVIPSAPQEDVLMQLLYEHGKTSRNVYDVTEVEAGFGASASVGVGGGVNVAFTDGERELRTSEFLGSPRQDGQRPLLPNSECVR